MPTTIRRLGHACILILAAAGHCFLATKAWQLTYEIGKVVVNWNGEGAHLILWKVHLPKKGSVGFIPRCFPDGHCQQPPFANVSATPNHFSTYGDCFSPPRLCTNVKKHSPLSP